MTLRFPITSYPQPTKNRLRSLTISGFELVEHVNKLSVYETIKKPYFTAKVTIIDQNNLIEQMDLVGEEQCDFSFTAGDEVLDYTLYVFSVHGMKSSNSMRAMVYDIHLIGIEYFNDKKNLVQDAFMGIPGTGAIAAIHSSYIGGALSILAGSLGPIAQESHRGQSVHPFKAIDDIKQRLNFPGGNDGNCLYFKNRRGMQLGPLSAFIAAAGNNDTYYQRATWGARWDDVFMMQWAIIAAMADVDDEKAGKASAQDMPAARNQEQKVFDQRTKKMVVNKQAGGGGHGGVPNYSIMDGANLPVSVDPSAMAIASNLFRAKVKGSPHMTVKVPIDSGVHMTVGEGAYFDLLPPIGDLNQPLGPSIMSGTYLITDLAHEMWLDDRSLAATTTVQGIKK